MRTPSIKTKLSLLVVAATALALALSWVGFVVHDVKMLRKSKAQELSALATILGYNTVAALSFDDPKMANRLLGSLREQPSVTCAWLYDAQGRLFGTYPENPPPSGPAPPAPRESGWGFAPSGELDVYQIITHDGEKLGSIQIRASRRDVDKQITSYSVIALLVLLFSLAVSYFLARRFQQFLTTPIMRLVDVMHQVAKDDNYSVRATKVADDELGVLNDGFNAMLDRVEHASRELQQSHDELEERVAQRTSELLVAKNSAETANRAKSVFLASMSHELRTPLNAVLGFSQLMRTDPSLSEGHKENLDIINRSGAHLLGLINDVLEMSRIEAGQVAKNETDFDLWGSLETIREMMRSRATAKGLRFVLERDPSLPRYVRTDERKLKQIIINLAGNAIKFTHEGTVTLRAKAGNRDNSLLFEVQDTGPGIDNDAIPGLFQPFVQGGHGKEGAGLGLFISEKLVALLGGKIAVESEQGKGSLFSFDVQCEYSTVREVVQPVARRVTGLVLPPGQSPPRILVAEDTRESRMLIVKLLQSAEFEVLEAENGLEAVRLFEERRPDLVLMDIRMPVMDGREAIRTIRASHHGRVTPIIAVTASAFEEDRQNILGLGADGFISKPVQTFELFDKIRSFLGVTYTYEEEPVQDVEAAGQASPREMAAGLPGELNERLTQAVIALNLDGIEALLPQVAKHSPSLAETLRELVAGCRMTELARIFPAANDGADHLVVGVQFGAAK